MPKLKYPKDLTGLKFGEWIVLGRSNVKYKWKCECSCGKQRDILRGNLISGDSTSCGHDSDKDKLIDLTGQKFGKLLVIQYSKENKQWLCECDCGNTVYKRSWDLRNNKASTCGKCKKVSNRLIDLTGQKFNDLEVIRYIGNSNWLCKCSCGNYISANSNRLRNGLTKSCGHNINKDKIIDLTGQRFGNLVAIRYIGSTKYILFFYP